MDQDTETIRKSLSNSCIRYFHMVLRGIQFRNLL